MARDLKRRESTVRPPPRVLFLLKYSHMFRRGKKEQELVTDHLNPQLLRLEPLSYRIAALALLVYMNRLLIIARHLARFDEHGSRSSTCSVEV